MQHAQATWSLHVGKKGHCGTIHEESEARNRTKGAETLDTKGNECLLKLFTSTIHRVHLSEMYNETHNQIHNEMHNGGLFKYFKANNFLKFKIIKKLKNNLKKIES